MKQFKYKDYMILCREGWEWSALIRRPNVPDVLTTEPRATKAEGLQILLARAKEAIDQDRA
jgi:hypothetical protein